jgi:hypothetical protein
MIASILKLTAAAAATVMIVACTEPDSGSPATTEGATSANTTANTTTETTTNTTTTNTMTNTTAPPPPQ